jgi:hypothetical protein
LALVWLANGPVSPARADGPIPIATNTVFYYRFDVKVGPHAFARPIGPWYSYFPMDPYLIAQPRAATYPNWPGQYPQAPAPVPMPGRAPMAPMGYYPDQPADPYAWAPSVYPAGYYSGLPMSGYWYAP